MLLQLAARKESSSEHNRATSSEHSRASSVGSGVQQQWHAADCCSSVRKAAIGIHSTTNRI